MSNRPICEKQYVTQDPKEKERMKRKASTNKLQSSNWKRSCITSLKFVLSTNFEIFTNLLIVDYYFHPFAHT
jgi:hypothetical protein